MGSMVEVKVPDIGDFKEVEVIEVLVKPGDAIGKEQSLITVESDKASMEIPSSHAGTVKEMRVKLGDKVSEGSLLLVLDAAEGAGAGAPPAPAPAAPAPAAAPPPPAAASPAPAAAAAHRHRRQAPSPPRWHNVRRRRLPTVAQSRMRRHRSASSHANSVSIWRSSRVAVRRAASRRTMCAAYVKGALAGGARPGATGAASAGAGLGLNLPAWPSVDFAKFGPVERVEMSRIKKISGPALTRNAILIPHVTNHEDADITDLEAFRVQLNKENERNKDAAKLTMLAFLIKACVATLKKFPDFNASLDAGTNDAIIRKNYWHIGFAADTPNGLVVPVIKDADKKGIFEIAAETSALAAKARDGKLGPADMQGGTFSISSLGGIGGTSFTPIINAPEVAILGVCRSAIKPVWDGKQFAPRLILPLSLSWDHRVVDGAAAARFNAHLAALLADFRRVML